VIPYPWNIRMRVEAGKELLARAILVDYRPKIGIRISLRFYSKDEEMGYAFQQIDDVFLHSHFEFSN
jgi:hypothetical protein